LSVRYRTPNQFYERTAKNQSTRARLCATVSALMRDVVWRHPPSVRAASPAQARARAPALAAVDNTRPGLETHTSAELGRDRAAPCTPVSEHVGGERALWLDGPRGHRIDGHGMEARQRRRGARRAGQAAALPGTSLVGYEPACGWGTDVGPGAEGHAQARAVCQALLRTAPAGDLWLAARPLWPRACLAALESPGAFVVLREPQGVPGELVRPRGRAHRRATGHVAAPRVRCVEAHGHGHRWRRLRLTRTEATRDGETRRSILTNGPRHTASPTGVSAL
jgi:hypothetical protein